MKDKLKEISNLFLFYKSGTTFAKSSSFIYIKNEIGIKLYIYIK